MTITALSQLLLENVNTYHVERSRKEGFQVDSHDCTLDAFYTSRLYFDYLKGTIN